MTHNKHEEWLDALSRYSSDDANVQLFKQAYRAYKSLELDCQLGSQTADKDQLVITIGDNSYAVGAWCVEVVDMLFNLLDGVMYFAYNEVALPPMTLE